MAKAIPTLASPVTVSKLDTTDWTREVWRLAYCQARAQIRDGGRFGLGARYVHCLGHLRRRFGPAGWPMAQKAAALALDVRTVAKAATGTREELAREGMLTRCMRLEAAPRGLGWMWAFCFDTLGSPHSAGSLRRGGPTRLREGGARRAEIARGLVADRRAMERGEFYVLTDMGRAAIAEAKT